MINMYKRHLSKSTGFACLAPMHDNPFEISLWHRVSQTEITGFRASHSNFLVWCGSCFRFERGPQNCLGTAILYYLPHFHAFTCFTESNLRKSRKNSCHVSPLSRALSGHSKCSKFSSMDWHLLWGTVLSLVHTWKH